MIKFLLTLFLSGVLIASLKTLYIVKAEERTESLVKAQYVNPPLRNDLKDIPEVKVILYDSSLVSQQLNLAFTTSDMKEALGVPITDPTSFQVISATRTFPPKVFGLANLARSGERFMFMDFRIHQNNLSSVYLTLKDSTGPNMDYYFIMKKDRNGKYNVIDTFLIDASVDPHSFHIDENGYYWFMANKHHPYDMSYRTENKRDTAATVMTTSVGVWDPATSTMVFEMDLWEKGLVPIDSIPINLIEVEGDDNLTFDVTHPNNWYPLGNVNGCPVGILSDLRDGIKFIRLCDSTVLRYGASAPDFKPMDSADHHLILQHDFKMIKEGPFKGYFACYDDGNEEYYSSEDLGRYDARIKNYNHRSARVPILSFNFDLKTVKMVHEFVFPNIYSIARGNVDFKDNYMLVNFGVGSAQILGKEPNWIIRNLTTDQVAAEYYLPCNSDSFPCADVAYAVWFMKDEEISRPEIRFNTRNEMSIDSLRWTNPLWSDGNSSYSVIASKDKEYYVTVNGGSFFRLVSDKLKLPVEVQ